MYAFITSIKLYTLYEKYTKTIEDSKFLFNKQLSHTK
jgi:hypothetical protein